MLSRKLAGRDSNPLDLAVFSHVLRAGSRVCFDVLLGLCNKVVMQNAIDEVVTRGFYGDLPLIYDAMISRLRRWESNPRHPAPEACTLNRQSIVCAFYFAFFFAAFRICFQSERPLVRSSRTSWCCRVSNAISLPFGRLA